MRCQHFEWHEYTIYTILGPQTWVLESVWNIFCSVKFWGFCTNRDTTWSHLLLKETKQDEYFKNIYYQQKHCNTVGNYIYIGHNGEQFHYNNIFASAETLIGKNITFLSFKFLKTETSLLLLSTISILCVQCLNDWLISQTNLKGTMLIKFVCHGNEKNLVSVYYILIFPNLLELALPSL